MSQLTNVQSIQMQGNRLTGTVPPLLCSVEGITELITDCGGNPPKVLCSCCTRCY